MADPLSISASIAGLVTLADAIFRVTFRFVKTAKNAKDDITQLASETQDLAGVLHRLSLLASALELDASQPTLRLHHVISCRQMLLRVDKTLSKAAADLESGETSLRVRRSLKWPFSSAETKELLDEIARHKGTLGLALAADSMDVLLQCLSRQKNVEDELNTLSTRLKETLEITTNIQLDDQRRRVLDFFMAANPQRNLVQCMRMRHPQTGLWLLDGEDFQQWLAVPNSRLWLSGIPGAGKTILAGAMISEALELASGTIGVAFFFCDYKDTQTHDAINILKTIASQLARQSQEAYMLLETYYKEIQPLQGLSNEPTLWELTDMIHQMVACFETVYMIIDGLDECAENARGVANTLASIAEDTSTVSLAILSRDEQVIREVLQHEFSPVDIEAQRDDVRLYVAAEIESRVQTGQLRLRNMALKDDILHALVNENGGMFRWVACQLDYLCELPRDKDRRQALKSLPPTLNETYQRILQRIESKDATVRHLVERCLQFISVAEPPLTSWELQEAISIDDDTAVLDSDSMVDEATILQNCSSLVRRRAAYDGTDTYIEFSHFSVAEYLRGSSLCGTNLEQYRISREAASRSLASSCLRMLCLDEMAYQPIATPQDFVHIAEKNWQHPFYPYAALLWPSYADSHWQDPIISDLVHQLFDQEKPGVFFSWALETCHLLLMPRYRSVRQAISSAPEPDAQHRFLKFSSLILQRGFTPLHFAAALGLAQVCRMLVDKGADVNSMCRWGAPLHFAASATPLLTQNKLSLDYSASDLSRPSSRSSATSGENFDEIPSEDQQESWLFDHFQVFDHSRSEIIELFLSHGAHLLNSPEQGRLALFQAALATSRRLKNLDIVTSLVRGGILLSQSDLRQFEALARQTWRVSSSEKGKKTMDHFISFLGALKDASPTSTAAARLYPLAFDLITSLGTNGTRHMGNSSLQAIDQVIGDPFAKAVVAAQYDNSKELKHILENNHPNLEQRANSKGETILHIAVHHESIESVRVLLSHGCSPSVPDSGGSLPLWNCTDDMNSAMLRLLLSHDVSQVKAKDIRGATIWHMAAARGSCEILRALMEQTPDFQRHLEDLNFEGASPLSIALGEAMADAAALMVTRHPGLVRKWNGKLPLMHAAAEVGSADLLQILIDSGADTQQEAADRSTPLHHLGVYSTPRCVQILKTLCHDLSARDSRGRRPLEAFVAKAESWYPLIGTREPSNHLQVFDELIPPEALKPVSDGPTFWEEFCAGASSGEQLRYGSNPAWLGTVVSRMMQLGVIAAHEEAKKTSAIPVFVSAFMQTPTSRRPARRRLDDSVVKLFHVTQYSEEAANSHHLVKLLHHCISEDHIDSTETFLGLGFNTNLRVDGYTALEVACLSSSNTSEKLLRILLDAIEAPSLDDLNLEKGGQGLIHLLGQKRQQRWHEEPTTAPRLECLINAGANPNLCTADGVPAVVLHIKSRKMDTAKLLVDMGADPTLRDNQGQDAITHAVLRGYVDFLAHVRRLEGEKLLPSEIQWDRKVDIIWDRRIRTRGRGVACNMSRRFVDGCFKGCNALHLAAIQGHAQVLEFYLNEGLIQNIEEMAEGGWTAMHFGAYRGSVTVIKLLHSRGAQVDAADTTEDAWTPYRVTLSKGGGAARMLLSLGAQQVGPMVAASSADSGSETFTDDDAFSMTSTASSQMGLGRRRPAGSPLPFIPSYAMRSRESSPRVARRPPSPDSVCWQFDYLRTGLLGPVDDPEMPFRKFHAAISQGDLETCQELVDKGCSVNGKMPCPTCTPLYCAFLHAQPKVFKWFLEKGGHIDIPPCPKHGDRFRSRIPRLPWIAASSPRLNGVLPLILPAYLAQGGNIFTDFDETPLHVALLAENFNAVRVLVDHVKEEEETYRRLVPASNSSMVSLFANQADDSGRSPLHMASESFDATRLLTENGADVNMLNSFGETPLHLAVNGQDMETADYLLQHGASLEVRDGRGDTPLMSAVAVGNFDIVKLLLERNPDLYAVGLYGNHILMNSTKNLFHRNNPEDLDIFFHLLSLGLDPNKTNFFDEAPLHIIFLGNSRRGLFLSRRLSVEATPPINWNELCSFRASWELGGPKFQMLVRALGKDEVGRVLNVHPSHGCSPLCVAAWHECVEGMKNLVSVGADIEFEGCDSGTALMAACEWGRLDAVMFLVLVQR
ncbi:hypothetical protein ACJ41O_010251 [Fusarium nematophilum]